MSLPTTSSSKPSQSSIRSFFQPRGQPKYAPPPPKPSSSPEPTPEAQLLAENAASEASKVQQQQQQQQQQHYQAQTQAQASTPPALPSSSVLQPTPSSQAGLPREATIRPLLPADIAPLKRINSLLLPVAYPDSFYATALSSPFSRAITWSDASTPYDPQTAKLIGAIVCRLEPIQATTSILSSPPSSSYSNSNQEHALYIQSLALLSPYRTYGLISAAFADILSLGVQANALNITQVYAHVWTDNEDGLRWYLARGFQCDPNPVVGYYLKLRPDSAYIVRRDLRPVQLSPASQTATLNLSSYIMGNATSSQQARAAGAPQQAAAPHAPPPRQGIVTAAAANLPPMNATEAPPTGPPPPPSSASASTARPLPNTRHGQSFQNKRAETEWNDLPADMMLAGSSSNGATGPPPPPLAASGGPTPSSSSASLAPPPPSSGNASEASSRSSSTVRKKKDRKYAAAAFGQ